MRYKFKLSMYVQESLVTGKRGYLHRFKRERRLAADNGGGWTLAVAYESDVSEGVQVKVLCYCIRR